MIAPTQFSGCHCEFSHAIPEEEFWESNAISCIPVRRSNAYKTAEKIIAALALDWAANVGGGDNLHYYASENTISGCFDSLILPESKPDRFDLTVWFTEFFILLDDKAEDLTREMAHTKLNPDIGRILADEGKKEPKSSVEKLLVPAIRSLLKKDSIRGHRVLEAWQYSLLNSDSKGLEDFETLEDYEEFRVMNSGMLPYSQMMEYTMELTLTDAERHDAKRLEQHAFKCIGISNDLWSWPKEAQAYKKGKRVMNGILIVMKIKKWTAHQAVIFIKKRVVQFQQELLLMRDEFLSAPAVSEDMRKYVNGYMWIVSGNELWQSTCPRYHPEFYIEL